MLKRSCWVALVAVSLIGFLKAQVARAGDTTESVEQAKKEVLKVNDEVDRGVGENDADLLGPLLSDDFRFTLQTGQFISKADWLAGKRSKKIDMVAISHEVSDVRVYGNTVVLTGLSRSKVIHFGEASNGPRIFTRVFVKQNGAWQLVAQHVTLVAK